MGGHLVASTFGPTSIFLGSGTAPFGLSPTVWSLVERGLLTLITLLVALVLLRLVPALERVIIRMSSKHDLERASVTASAMERRQRAETLTRVTGSIARGIIWALTVFIVLGNLGIDIAPLVAGAGIAGVAVGFGAQSIVKDFFAGFFILLESQFDVGDTVTVAGVTGTVERMSLRVTMLRDVMGTAHFIPNSSITIVSNRTDGWVRVAVDAVFGPAVEEKLALEALEAAADAATQSLQGARALTGDVEIEGPAEFNALGVTWRLVARARPERVLDVRRAIISALAAQVRGRGFVGKLGALVSRPPAA